MNVSLRKKIINTLKINRELRLNRKVGVKRVKITQFSWK